jgi:hypothetical protein
MALTPTEIEPVRAKDLFGWAIKMLDDEGSTVRVLVSDSVLENFAPPPDNGSKRLTECRSYVEDIASAKHSAGKIEPDGSVHVTSEDVK